MDQNEISVAEYLRLIEQRQRSIETLLLSQKNVLTFDETATFMGISKSHLYKMTMLGSIEFYKPRGKMIYFERESVEKFLLQNRITPTDEIEVQAGTYIATRRGRASL